MSYQILKYDPMLKPFEGDINLRMDNYKRVRRRLTGRGTLSGFANAHEFYGFHHTDEGWVYRDWAPGADALYLMGEFNGWQETATPLRPIGSGLRHQMSSTVQVGFWLMKIYPHLDHSKRKQSQSSYGNSSAQNQCVDYTAVHITRQDDFISTLTAG